MLKVRLFLACVATMMVLSTAVLADDEVDLKDVKCVLNPKGAAKATSSADYKGGKVYFCCDNCKGKFTEDSKKYAAAANAQLVATKQAKQQCCPLMGKPVKEGVSVKVAGIEVGLCCPGCKGKIEKMEEKDQIDALFGEKSFTKAFKMAKDEEEKDDDA